MLHRHQSLSPTLAQVYKLAPADRDAHTDTDLSAMTETSVAGVRSDVKKVIEASVCSRSVVRDAALSWRSAGRAGGGGSNDGNPVAWLQPSAYGGERRHHPVRATCLIGAGRQGQSILKQCEPATSQLPVCEEELGEVVLRRLRRVFDPLPSIRVARRELLRLWSDSKRPGFQAACFWTFLFGDLRPVLALARRGACGGGIGGAAKGRKTSRAP